MHWELRARVLRKHTPAQPTHPVQCTASNHEVHSSPQFKITISNHMARTLPASFIVGTTESSGECGSAFEWPSKNCATVTAIKRVLTRKRTLKTFAFLIALSYGNRPLWCHAGDNGPLKNRYPAAGWQDSFTGVWSRLWDRVALEQNGATCTPTHTA